MSTQPTLGRIRPESPRAADWRKVFGADAVPLKSPVTHRGAAPGYEEGAEFYQLDLDALTPEQHGRLLEHLSERFGIPRVELAAEIRRAGVPVLADEVSLSFDMRLLL